MVTTISVICIPACSSMMWSHCKEVAVQCCTHSTNTARLIHIEKQAESLAGLRARPGTYMLLQAWMSYSGNMSQQLRQHVTAMNALQKQHHTANTNHFAHPSPSLLLPLFCCQLLLYLSNEVLRIGQPRVYLQRLLECTQGALIIAQA